MLENLTTMALSQSLAVGAWDVGSLLKNATSTLKGWGSLLIILIGVAMLVWAFVLLGKKLMASQQQAQNQAGWPQIILLIIVGGAGMIGGWSLMQDIGSGGKTTVYDLGNGAAFLLGNLPL